VKNGEVAYLLAVIESQGSGLWCFCPSLCDH